MSEGIPRATTHRDRAWLVAKMLAVAALMAVSVTFVLCSGVALLIWAF